MLCCTSARTPPSLKAQLITRRRYLIYQAASTPADPRMLSHPPTSARGPMSLTTRPLQRHCLARSTHLTNYGCVMAMKWLSRPRRRRVTPYQSPSNRCAPPNNQTEGVSQSPLLCLRSHKLLQMPSPPASSGLDPAHSRP